MRPSRAATPPKAPVLFGKFANTLLWDGDPILLPAGVGHVDAEAELALVIGERASHVPEASAVDVIEAYTCANDVSARDMQFGDAQWFRGKCPTASARSARSSSTPPAFDWRDVRVQQRLNGEVLQDARTSDLIFTIPVLVSYISRYITLEPRRPDPDRHARRRRRLPRPEDHAAAAATSSRSRSTGSACCRIPSCPSP